MRHPQVKDLLTAYFLSNGKCARLVLLLSLLCYAPAQAQKAAVPPSGDGPITVEGGQVFKQGTLNFEEVDPAKVAPMPKGWVAFKNTAYKLDYGEGVTVGPHVIRFSVASAGDRKLFDSLAILQAEWDKIDEKYFWLDRTILAPDAHAPDFNSKTISAKAERLGVFVIAQLVETQPPDRATADLSVEIVAPTEKAIANRELAYEIKITNHGPQNAAGIVLNGAGFASNEFVSATPPARGGGRCKQDGSNYGCKLDLLEKGSTAVFRLVLVPREMSRGRDGEGAQRLIVDSYVVGNANDPNFENNEARSDLLVSPDPNLEPQVKFNAPAEGELFVAPADIKLSVEARDPDGTLAKVEFYVGSKLLGEGEWAGKDQYGIVWHDAPPGPHQLTVMVTDDGGRQNYATMWVRVNGGLTVRVAAPLPGAAFNRTSRFKAENEIVYGPLSFEAAAFVGGSVRGIKEVAFLLRHDTPDIGGRKEIAKHTGADNATGDARYVATFSDLEPASYVLTVIATDVEGVESVSQPVRFRVNVAPVVKLRPVATAGPAMTAPADVSLVAEVSSGEDPILGDTRSGKVDFYADGKIIGSAPLDGFVGLAYFKWRGVPAGGYNITAIATDGNGLVSVPSAPLRLTVRNR
jgi:hypothetical protein